MLLAQVDLPAAHGREARAKPIVLRSHAVARRVALGTETVGFLQSALYGLRKIEHPISAVALPTGRVALKVPLTAHEGYSMAAGGGTSPSTRRVACRRWSSCSACRACALSEPRSGRAS